MAIRSFTSQLEDSGVRSVDNDAPSGVRQEFIDLAFLVFENAMDWNEAKLHKIITRSLGFTPSGQPTAAFATRWGATSIRPMRPEYRIGVNRILAGYRVVWDLGEDGRLHRVLPPFAHTHIERRFGG